MFNDKAARRFLNQTNRRKIDAIDEEAERQGSARQFFTRNELGPANLGRRISKESRKASGAQTTADYKATKNLVKDTAKVAKRLIVPQYKLSQV
jgi:hypothetical protein